MAKQTKINAPRIEDKTRPDLAIGQADENTYIAKTEKPNLGKRVRELGHTKQQFYSEKVTDMRDLDLDTFNRFQASFRSSKAKAMASEGEVPKKGNDIPTLDHGSRRGLHRTLASVQRVVFADHVTTLDEAKARLQAIVDVAGTGADDDAALKKAKK